MIMICDSVENQAIMMILPGIWIIPKHQGIVPSSPHLPGMLGPTCNHMHLYWHEPKNELLFGKSWLFNNKAKPPKLLKLFGDPVRWTFFCNGSAIPKHPATSIWNYDNYIAILTHSTYWFSHSHTPKPSHTCTLHKMWSLYRQTTRASSSPQPSSHTGRSPI